VTHLEDREGAEREVSTKVSSWQRVSRHRGCGNSSEEGAAGGSPASFESQDWQSKQHLAQWGCAQQQKCGDE
jgi:hypothetical protein